MKLDPDLTTLLHGRISQMDIIRKPHQELWRELADYILPRRYTWLEDQNSTQRIRNMRNPNILDSTGTRAARVLASGMMNGITSPARPWFNLRIAGNDEINMDREVRMWLDEVTRRMMLVLSESNFYNAIAVLYLDLVVFGTASMLVYEDFESVIRCYNNALGEYYLGQDDRGVVNSFARSFQHTAEQLVRRWGLDHVSETVRNAYNQGGGSRQTSFTVYHLIESNADGKFPVSKSFKFREVYWEKGAEEGCLAYGGFHEMPGVFPRWELVANDCYGASPGMDALGDIIQLQHETKRKAQGLDKMMSPPLLVDIQLQHKPISAIPGGITFASGNSNSFGAKPLYQIAPPLGEISNDINQIQLRISETFHNSLFQMISNLDTVRSATEIDARREEKLVLLGPVLERFENEALSPALSRTFSIMNRMDLFPPAPPVVRGAKIEVQYVSILSTAQSAVAAIPTERWIGFIGNIAPVKPEVLNIPDWEEVIRSYGSDLGGPAKMMMDREKSQQAAAAQQQAATDQAGIQGAVGLTQAAQQLSNTDVGGGANALQAVLGGA